MTDEAGHLRQRMHARPEDIPRPHRPWTTNCYQREKEDCVRHLFQELGFSAPSCGTTPSLCLPSPHDNGSKGRARNNRQMERGLPSFRAPSFRTDIEQEKTPQKRLPSTAWITSPSSSDLTRVDHVCLSLPLQAACIHLTRAERRKRTSDVSLTDKSGS